MKKPVLIVALVGALTLGLYVTAGGQAGGQAEATKVCVVNLQQVINECDQQAAFRAENTAATAALQEEGKRRQDELNALQNALDPLEPSGDAWRNKREELQVKTLEARVWQEYQQQKVQLDQARRFAVLYQAVTDASGEVAKSMGYDVVLQTGELPDLMQLNAQQLQSVVASRKVIYSSDAADITAEVLARANAEFK